MLDYQDVIDEANCRMSEMLSQDEWEEVEVEDYRPRLGLDPRAYVQTWVERDGDCMITRGSTRALEYYGGFEYVERDARVRVGEYTVWRGNVDDRVAGHVERWNDG